MRRRPDVGVLAVQGDVREHIRMLESLGVAATTVRRPSELAEVDGLIIPGGESSTMDKLVRSLGLYEPIRHRIAGGMPAYGSCAGMIMLADRIADAPVGQQTLGGLDITVRRNAFGRQVDSFEQDLTIPELRHGDTDPVRAVFIRAPWVEQAGKAAQVLARVSRPTDADADGRVVAVRQGNVLATSFHPEVTGEHRVHEYFVGIVRARS